MWNSIENCLLAVLLASVLLLFTGCSQPVPIELSATPTTELMTGYATLSDSSNPADMSASVVYTKLAMLRRLAAKRLRNGDISVDDALYYQYRADGIRSLLDTALAKKDMAEISALKTNVATLLLNLEMSHVTQ